MKKDPEPGFIRPVVEHYGRYRDFLKDMVAYLKASNPRFSYRYFAQRAGFTSPSFLKHVVDGKREIASRSVGKFARGLGLTSDETDAFETLVLLSQAHDDNERNRLYDRLRQKRRKTNRLKLLEEAQYEVYSDWYVLVIREMLLLPDFNDDPKWIAARLHPPVTPRQAEAGLAMLERIGLAAKDPGRKLKTGNTVITTPLQLRSLAVRNFHRAMLEKSVASLDEISVEERNHTSLTVKLNRRQDKHVCDRISEFQEELLEYVNRPLDRQGAPDGDEIYHLGFQVVPLTRSNAK